MTARKYFTENRITHGLLRRSLGLSGPISRLSLTRQSVAETNSLVSYALPGSIKRSVRQPFWMPLTRATRIASVIMKSKVLGQHEQTFHDGRYDSRTPMGRMAWCLTSHWQRFYALIFVNEPLAFTSVSSRLSVIIRAKEYQSLLAFALSTTAWWAVNVKVMVKLWLKVSVNERYHKAFRARPASISTA